MKKNKLLIEYDFDFQLLGISSPARSFKLAWDINKALSVNLVKDADLVVGFKNNEERRFLFYSFETPLNRLKLFKNRPVDQETGKYFLIPEFPHFDFIILAAMEAYPQQMLIDKLRNVSSIQLVSAIPMEGLKSKANFIF
ncbi:MAG TPA: IPExxxVDY family protein [Chryseosolibacter sp.]|nr:IPExxxVDY family protein [Chryseosolibacter sp.]